MATEARMSDHSYLSRGSLLMSATFELEKKHQTGAVRTLAYLNLGSGYSEKQKPKSP